MEEWKNALNRLRPADSFQMHINEHNRVSTQELLPIWFQNDNRTNMKQLMKDLNCNTYKELYEWSNANRESYWLG